MQAEPTDVIDAPDANAVIRFLTSNPDFFNQNLDLLPRLRIPHDSGRAVSLIERQVSVLRGKCASLEGSLRDLIGVARDNEALQGRVHELVQEIISASSIDAVIAATRRSLIDNFGADVVHVVLIADDAKMGETDSSDDAASDGSYRRLDRDDRRLADLVPLFDVGSTRCGLPSPSQLGTLAGDDLSDIGSAAVIPLQHDGKIGLVMLTCRDEARFAEGKGVVFLDQLGDVLGRRLDVLRRDAS